MLSCTLYFGQYTLYVVGCTLYVMLRFALYVFELYIYAVYVVCLALAVRGVF
jgi:hypothetical protein